MTNLNAQNYNESVSSGLSVVTFSASWCRDCAVLKPILARLEPDFADKINFFMVDFDNEDSLKDSLNIRRIPTMIFYKNAEEIGTRLVEPNSTEQVKKALEALINA